VAPPLGAQDCRSLPRASAALAQARSIASTSSRERRGGAFAVRALFRELDEHFAVLGNIPSHPAIAKEKCSSQLNHDGWHSDGWHSDRWHNAESCGQAGALPCHCLCGQCLGCHCLCGQAVSWLAIARALSRRSQSANDTVLALVCLQPMCKHRLGIAA
jgi:hypothetical protein